MAKKNKNFEEYEFEYENEWGEFTPQKNKRNIKRDGAKEKQEQQRYEALSWEVEEDR